MNHSMMLIKSEWESKQTFRLIPISEECPYVEGIFDPQTKVLVVFSKLLKDGFHMLPRLDDNGDPQMLKNSGKPRFNGKPYKEERRTLQTFHEYYLSDTEDIKSFITKFCDNSNSFDYLSYLAEETISA